MRRLKILFILLAVAGFVLIVSSDTTEAYSISGASPLPQPQQTDFGVFTVPFENFLHSVNSVNSIGNVAPQLNLSIPQQGGGSFITTGIQNAFQQFDSWLYGIAGFHISGFFTAILSIFSWLLGIVKSIVDWLLGAIK
ncbi:MAG: hypothetical protein ABSC29_04320 [Minisyncoccia bacterium]|jgi:hypothetical protein